MDIDTEVTTPTEVIRCVYLARLAQQRGDSESAECWQAKVDRWRKRIEPEAGDGPSEVPIQ